MISIAGADWLVAPETRAVIAALEAARSGSARFVGGCVRNTIMGRPVSDVDIATQLRPDQTITALETANIRAIPTGVEHGTVTAVASGVPFEITTLRKDVETDGRRAVVAFTEDWAEDAARRDFRLNALYATPDGSVHEGVPGGLTDAKEARVIFIGDADERLREDYLRILRFFRFSAWYGGEMDAEGLAACARQTAGLRKIAAERIWKETRRMLEAPDPAASLRAMEAAGVLADVLPNASTGLVSGLVAVETETQHAPDPMQRLMALLPRRRREADETSHILKLSNAERDRLAAWAAPDLPHMLGQPDQTFRAALYRHGQQAVMDRAMIEAAGGRSGDLRGLLDVVKNWQRPDFPLTGEDALALGLSGPEIGRALRAAEDWWIGEDFTPDRNALLDWLTRSSA